MGLETDVAIDEVMAPLLFTTSVQSVGLLMMLVAYIVALIAAYKLYKMDLVPWNKVIYPCLLIAALVNLSLVVLQTTVEWELLIYLEAVLVASDSALLLLMAMSFSKLIKFLGSSIYN